MNDDLMSNLMAAADELLPDGSGRDIVRMVAQVAGQATWADNEIRQAIKRHPDREHQLYHSMELLNPTHELMRTEFVYRAHCREMLDRVAHRADTRPPTAVEIALTCSMASLEGPLTTGGTALYVRMWVRAFPDIPVPGEHAESYEHIGGPEADELERQSMRRLRRPERVPGQPTCPGKHWGEPARDCPFATPVRAGSPAA